MLRGCLAWVRTTYSPQNVKAKVVAEEEYLAFSLENESRDFEGGTKLRRGNIDPWRVSKYGIISIHFGATHVLLSLNQACTGVLSPAELDAVTARNVQLRQTK